MVELLLEPPWTLKRILKATEKRSKIWGNHPLFQPQDAIVTCGFSVSPRLRPTSHHEILAEVYQLSPQLRERRSCGRGVSSSVPWQPQVSTKLWRKKNLECFLHAQTSSCKFSNLFCCASKICSNVNIKLWGVGVVANLIFYFRTSCILPTFSPHWVENSKSIR